VSLGIVQYLIKPFGFAAFAEKLNAYRDYDRVRTAMREAPSGAMSATELAAALDLSRVTARRYLEHLADTGVVERAGRYGAPGRPEVEYRRR
jgi:response regulator of citrate/malate metabolism